MRENARKKMNARAVGRMSLYRRMLQVLEARGVDSIFSHELATLAGTSASQVRRDLMSLGTTGSPSSGYAVKDLARAISEAISGVSRQPVVIVGVGNLGRAVLHYFQNNHPSLEIVAGFDSDPEKRGRVISGTPVYGLSYLSGRLAEHAIRTAVLTVPAESAQEVTDLLVGAGVVSILNMTNLRLKVPEGVYVEDTDIGVALERVAYFGK